MSLLDKLKKNTRIKESSILEQSTLMEVPFQIATLVKSINVALSGDPEGGMEPGLLMLAGPSKHFKCVSGDTPIEVYVLPNFEQVKTTYQELFDGVTKIKEGNGKHHYFVKTPNGFAPILAVVKKQSDTFDIEFDNGTKLTAGDRHNFMDQGGTAIAVEDMEVGVSKVRCIDGSTTTVTSLGNFKQNQEVYDIGIESPHWYTNSVEHGGLIHHNTNMALVIASAFLRKFEDGIILFYDSEFGASKKYFESAGIDPNRVFHTPVTDIEQLKHDTMSQLNELKRGDHVLILVDSIGNLASAKETQDAIDGKSVADMTRAKALKSYFRMVTPHLTIKGIPLIAVNHTYKEIGCLEEHTLIKTDKGDVQIKNIQVGDMVYGVTGLKPVTHIFTPDQLPTDGKRFFELTFDDGSTVRCTDNHKFLGDDGEWIAAADMKIGQRFK